MDIRSLYELPKDMLVKIIMTMGDVRNMSNEEIVVRQRELEEERVNRKYRVMRDNIKRGLLNLACIPLLHPFVAKNMDYINAIEEIKNIPDYTYMTVNGTTYPLTKS